MIVLFTSGSWSDYGLQGLLEVDEAAYRASIAEYEAIDSTINGLVENLKRRQQSGDITRNQASAIGDQIAKCRGAQYDIWESLRKTGKPVDFTEFHYGD